MEINSVYKNFKTISVLILIVTFFLFYFNKISYGLPYFWNPDEIEFQNSLISVLYFVSDQLILSYNPLYAPLINVILILKSIFINEFLINSLSLDQIKSKIYFNPELFVFYGRLSSLIISTFSIFFLFLIFKKLKINFYIYFIILLTFSTSLVMFNISTIMGKNSCNLLLYLIQIYFLIKYSIKIEKFNSRSYLIFGILAAIAWGVNYWPAFISMYAVLCLHLRKYKFSKINFLIIFSVIFIIFGPFLNLFFVNMSPFEHLAYSNEVEKIESITLVHSFLDDVVISLKTIYFTDKNILLLIAVTPIFLINKYTNFKKEFLIIIVLFIEPIILFGIAGTLYPQLRYFAGIISVILILSAIVFNELHKTKFKYLIVLFFGLNFYLISDNIIKIHKSINVLNENHSFFKFNKNIEIDHSKILYLVDLNFQENLKQNLYYKNLFENNLINKDQRSKKFYEKIENKIQSIKNSDNILIIDKKLKENIIYHNYTFFQISDLKEFFNFIKKEFDYVLIEESEPPYLSSTILQNNIKSYVKNNFKLNRIQYDKNKIFLRHQQSIIHYFSNNLTPYDLSEESYVKGSEVIFGTNYGLYKLK